MIYTPGTRILTHAWDFHATPPARVLDVAGTVLDVHDHTPAPAGGARPGRPVWAIIRLDDGRTTVRQLSDIRLRPPVCADDRLTLRVDAGPNLTVTRTAVATSDAWRVLPPAGRAYYPEPAPVWLFDVRWDTGDVQTGMWPWPGLTNDTAPCPESTT